MAKAVRDIAGGNGAAAGHGYLAQRVARPWFHPHVQIDPSRDGVGRVCNDVSFCVLKALRAQVVAHASTLGVEKAVPPLSRRGQGLPVANAELPEDRFLANALTKNGLIARHEDLTDAIEGLHTNLKACSTRVRLNRNLSLIAHGLE
jgi:hypothetical protein